MDEIKQLIAAMAAETLPLSIPPTELAEILNRLADYLDDSLGENYKFVGIATQSSSPVESQYPVFYLAGPGGYPNYGNTVVPAGCLGVFSCNTGRWRYTILDFASSLGTPADSANATGSAFARLNYLFGNIGKSSDSPSHNGNVWEQLNYLNKFRKYIGVSAMTGNYAFATRQEARQTLDNDDFKYGTLISYKLADGTNVVERYLENTYGPNSYGNSLWEDVLFAKDKLYTSAQRNISFLSGNYDFESKSAARQIAYDLNLIGAGTILTYRLSTGDIIVEVYNNKAITASTVTNDALWNNLATEEKVFKDIRYFNLSAIANNYAFTSKEEARTLLTTSITGYIGYPKYLELFKEGTMIQYKLASGDIILERYNINVHGPASLTNDNYWDVIGLQKETTASYKNISYFNLSAISNNYAFQTREEARTVLTTSIPGYGVLGVPPKYTELFRKGLTIQYTMASGDIIIERYLIDVYGPDSLTKDSFWETLSPKENEKYIDSFVLGHKYGNYFDKSNITQGYYVKTSDGSLGTSTNYFTSDFIDIEDLSDVWMQAAGYTDYYAFYDKNKKFIPYEGETDKYHFVVPSGAKYFRFSASINYISYIGVYAYKTGATNDRFASDFFEYTKQINPKSLPYSVSPLSNNNYIFDAYNASALERSGIVGNIGDFGEVSVPIWIDNHKGWKMEFKFNINVDENVDGDDVVLFKIKNWTSYFRPKNPTPTRGISSPNYGLISTVTGYDNGRFRISSLNPPAMFSIRKKVFTEADVNYKLKVNNTGLYIYNGDTAVYTHEFTEGETVRQLWDALSADAQITDNYELEFFDVDSYLCSDLATQEMVLVKEIDYKEHQSNEAVKKLDAFPAFVLTSIRTMELTMSIVCIPDSKVLAESAPRYHIRCYLNDLEQYSWDGDPRNFDFQSEIIDNIVLGSEKVKVNSFNITTDNTTFHRSYLLTYMLHFIDDNTEGNISVSGKVTYGRLARVIDYAFKKGYYFPTAQELSAQYTTRKATHQKQMVFIFDDTGIDQITNKHIRDLFIRYGVKPIVAVTTKNDLTEKMPLIKAMQNIGWGVVSHSHYHGPLGLADYPRIKDDVDKNTQAMLDYGFYSDILIYPNGSYDSAAAKYLQYHGFALAFSATGHAGQATRIGDGNWYGAAGLYGLNRASIQDGQCTWEEAKQLIDAADKI